MVYLGAGRTHQAKGVDEHGEAPLQVAVGCTSNRPTALLFGQLVEDLGGTGGGRRRIRQREALELPAT